MSQAVTDGDVLKCTPVVVGLPSQVALPSFYFLVGLTSGSPTDQDMADTIDGWAGSDLVPLLANAASYRGTLVQRIQPLPITRRVSSVANAGNGTGGSTYAPPQAAPILQFQTPLAGPAQRGRFYIPFPPGNVIDPTNGVVNATYRSAMLLAASDLLAIATIGGGGNIAAVNLVIWHKTTRDTDIVASVSASILCGTQKRRGDYGKTNVSPL